MDVRDSKPSHIVAPVRPAFEKPAAPAALTRRAMEVIRLLDGELTPRGRQAVMALCGEVEQLQQALGDARLRIGHLERLVDEDPLIPVANRRAFIRELSRMIAFAKRYGVPGSMIYFDIDNMKQINDTHGHAAGDAALLQVALRLAENVRATDVVGRFGGDELGVLLVQADAARAGRKAAELAAAVTVQPLLWDGKAIRLSVAYGVCAFTGGEEAAAVINAADRAMYRQKNNQKNNQKNKRKAAP